MIWETTKYYKPALLLSDKTISELGQPFNASAKITITLFSDIQFPLSVKGEAVKIVLLNSNKHLSRIL